jgi:hypothetical protein
MIRAVHPGILHQDVQAVYEGARGGRPVCVKCGRVVDKTPLNPQLWLGIERLNPAGKSLHITEVTEELAGDHGPPLYPRSFV